MRLWPRTVSNANNKFEFKHTPMQCTPFLSCCVNATLFHTRNEHKRTVAIIIVVHSDNALAWDYNLIMRPILIKASNSTNTNANVQSVRQDERFIDPRTLTHSRHRRCRIFWQHIRVRLHAHIVSGSTINLKFNHTPIMRTVSNTNKKNSNPSSHKCKRTCCSSRVNTTLFHTCERNRRCRVFGQHTRLGLLRPLTVCKTNEARTTTTS